MIQARENNDELVAVLDCTRRRFGELAERARMHDEFLGRSGVLSSLESIDSETADDEILTIVRWNSLSARVTDRV